MYVRPAEFHGYLHLADHFFDCRLLALGRV